MTKFDFLLKELTRDAVFHGHVDSSLSKRLTRELVEHPRETALRPPSNTQATPKHGKIPF